MLRRGPGFQFLCASCHLLSPIRLALMAGNGPLSAVSRQSESYQVVIAAGSHLFPFRTEKLSPPAPMVLQCNAGE